MPQGAARAFQNEEYFYDDHSTNQLVPAKANVRKTGAKDGIEELAASIAAHGLLTSLDVRKDSRGKYPSSPGSAVTARSCCSPDAASSRPTTRCTVSSSSATPTR